MSKIKTKDIIKGTIKGINKGAIAIEKTKDTIVTIKEKGENVYQFINDEDSNTYANEKLESRTSKTINSSISKIDKFGRKSVKDTKENIQKTKGKLKQVKDIISKRKKVSKTASKGIKSAKNTVKNTKKVVKESVKVMERARKVAIETTKKTYQAIKVSIKVTISSIKAIIASTKALISAIAAGGWIAVIAIIVICLVGLLCSSIFGIFFSSEDTGNGMSMKNVISECNQEFANKLQTIQDQNPHDDFVLEGSMSSWKDILVVYTVKMSNGKNESDVVTLNENKKNILKNIFWEMNEVTFEVKDEKVIERGINSNEMPKEVDKKVLHIKINSKNMNDMKVKYNFTPSQNKQLTELANSKYDSLWGGVIYGLDGNSNSDGYKSWRQSGASWSNIRIGSTNSTISDIGCLVTSIAILIAKSGVPTGNIKDFNPGTFVEALNQNGGFDSGGNLQYGAINRVVPNFKYVGKINLRGKSRDDKFHLISGYINQGYYLTAEVKGATAGNQHWVAIIDIDLNNIIMVDPASNQTILWNAYEFSKTSQFNYFKVN